MKSAIIGLAALLGMAASAYAMEPAKVMVTWDGTVKVLSFGVSSAGWVAASATGAPSSVLHYMAPEQVNGEKLDACSNLFTWGAILYEMVTDQKAFDGVDADEVRHKILHEMPVSPALISRPSSVRKVAGRGTVPILDL